MSKPIPIKNLYYLLSYTWNDRLKEGDLEDIDDTSCPDLATFFSQVITSRLAPLLRSGIDRAYTEHHELTPQPRGRIDFTASAKRQTWNLGKMYCSYSDLTKDVPHNRIIKATLTLLYRETQISADLKQTLHRQIIEFSEVKSVKLTPRSFHRIQLHRNNRAYRFILHLCELIILSLLPEHDQEGKRKFRRIEQNETVMRSVFEKFIFEFSKRNLTNIKLPSKRIQWQAEYAELSSKNLMPTMNTDLTIEWTDSNRKLILDCKYYKNAFTSQVFGDQEYTRFKTENLYQVFAYLINKRENPGWKNVEGMLLYPTTTEDFHEELTLLKQHKMQICSINLNQDWQAIKRQLISILTD